MPSGCPGVASGLDAMDKQGYYLGQLPPAETARLVGDEPSYHHPYRLETALCTQELDNRGLAIRVETPPKRPAHGAADVKDFWAAGMEIGIQARLGHTEQGRVEQNRPMRVDNHD
jgi:hypothetical protein